jgi:hypothetical protein
MTEYFVIITVIKSIPVDQIAADLISSDLVASRQVFTRIRTMTVPDGTSRADLFEHVLDSLPELRDGAIQFYSAEQNQPVTS